MNLAALIKDAKKDPALQSHIDIKSILSNATNSATDDMTIESVSDNVFDSLQNLGLTKTIISDYCNKLIGYKYTDQLHLLQKGKYVRWIHYDNPTVLMKGGVVIDVQFGDMGANILCRLVTGRYLRYRFDKCNTYQKMTEEEQMILMMNGK